MEKRYFIPYLVWLNFLFFCFACGVEKPTSIKQQEDFLPEEIDYNFHVKPILADRCFSCHGPDKGSLEAGLRLDHRENALSELPESPGKKAIVPRNLSKSQLYHRIISEDKETIMPPPESKLTLTDYEKAILIKWIEQGAEYKPHWSLMSLIDKKMSVIKEMNGAII